MQFLCVTGKLSGQLFIFKQDTASTHETNQPFDCNFIKCPLILKNFSLPNLLINN